MARATNSAWHVAGGSGKRVYLTRSWRGTRISMLYGDYVGIAFPYSLLSTSKVSGT